MYHKRIQVYSDRIVLPYIAFNCVVNQVHRMSPQEMRQFHQIDYIIYMLVNLDNGQAATDEWCLESAVF